MSGTIILTLILTLSHSHTLTHVYACRANAAKSQYLAAARQNVEKDHLVRNINKELVTTKQNLDRC